MSTQPDKTLANQGAFHDRCVHNKREAAFATAWEKENEPCANLNYGYGLLQDLFCKPHPQLGYAVGGVADHIITDDERMVTATAIQWLGSNCGWCFLEEVLNACGYKLTKIE